VEIEQWSKIVVGLLRVTRALGVTKGYVRHPIITDHEHAIFEMMDNSSLRKSSWGNWVAFVANLEFLDSNLHQQFKRAADVAALKKPSSNFSPGDWVWWQHADGRIGIVLDSEDTRVTVAYEPKLAKKVAASYLVALKEIDSIQRGGDKNKFHAVGR
jgi:hypothetical protein